MKNKTRGITLIALVVTIVVLLILAAVSISMLTGENGIITQAQKSKNENDIATEKEYIKLSYNSCKSSDYSKIVTDEDMQKELDKEVGENKTFVYLEGENLIIIFNESNRTYKISQDGIINEQETIPPVEDDTPGIMEGEGTKENPYKIQSIEDLVSFSIQVNQGNTFKEQYIVLNNDLDFFNNNSYADEKRKDFGDINGDNIEEELKTELTKGNGFPTIGLTEEGFEGIFDGQNHKLKNYYVEKIQEYIGIFGYNKGMITNFNLENINLNIVEGANGATCLCAENEGSIVNCNIYGDVKIKNIKNFSVMNYINSGIIFECSNLADVDFNVEYNSEIYFSVISYENNGGIILSSNQGNINVKNGSNNKSRARPFYLTYCTGISFENSGEINGCYNTGKIEAFGIEGYHVSGITNTNTGKIYNCYNTGEIIGKGEDNSKGCVGIVFYNDNGIIQNCYNVGGIHADDSISNAAIVGKTEQMLVTNCYYLIDTAQGTPQIDTVIEKNEEQMKSNEFLNEINKEVNSELGINISYIKDTGVNNGYPILKENTN